MAKNIIDAIETRENQPWKMEHFSINTLDVNKLNDTTLGTIERKGAILSHNK